MTEAADDDFDDLLSRVRGGDNQAADALVQRYESIVRRAAHGLLGPELRAQLDSMDVVQSVHRSLLIGLRNQKFDISSPQRLIGLAVVMVRRKVARQWRKCKRQNLRSLPEQSGLHGMDALPGPDPDPAELAQFDDRLQRLLNELDPLDRQLVWLRLQGHSTAEAARLQGVDATLLRVRLSRLRGRLRDAGQADEWI